MINWPIEWIKNLFILKLLLEQCKWTKFQICKLCNFEQITEKLVLICNVQTLLVETAELLGNAWSPRRVYHLSLCGMFFHQCASLLQGWHITQSRCWIISNSIYEKLFIWRKLKAHFCKTQCVKYITETLVRERVSKFELASRTGMEYNNSLMVE